MGMSFAKNRRMDKEGIIKGAARAGDFAFGGRFWVCANARFFGRFLMVLAGFAGFSGGARTLRDNPGTASIRVVLRSKWGLKTMPGVVLRAMFAFSAGNLRVLRKKRDFWRAGSGSEWQGQS
jgi:hypothetical protein